MITLHVAIMIVGVAACAIVLTVVAMAVLIERGATRLERVIAEWEVQRNAAPADSTYLDPHRGDGPVLVAPDEGDWRQHGSHFDEDARAFRRSWIETGRWDV